MGKTIKQIADQIGISRNGVEMRISQIPNFRDKYTKKSGNKIVISGKGCQSLLSMGKQSINNKGKSLNSYKTQIKILKTKLEANQKENQRSQHLLKQSNQGLIRLEKLLDQQQQLQLATQKENNELKGHIRRLRLSGTHTHKAIKFPHKKRKTGFWAKFFGED